MTRRDFVGGAAAFAAAGSLAAGRAESPKDIRAVLIPWGCNMWGESLPEDIKSISGGYLCKTSVKFDEAMWRKLIDRIVQRKINTVLIDLGGFPVYPSHPELAMKGSKSPDWILAEVRRLRKLGLEPVPKLNFSTAHDAWLGEYGRMVTTRQYYKVCRDIIRDVSEMFDHPRYFHIGYDEETAAHQRGFQCVRTDEVWWHDFLWFVKTVEDAGMRTWMWSDYGWKHDDFVEKCPKSVLHSNWYYDEWMEGFDLATIKPDARSRPLLELFLKLDKAGFDQVPCASNWRSSMRDRENASNDECMAKLVKFCRANIAPERLKGFLMASWSGDYDSKDFMKGNIDAIDQLADALA